MRASLRSLVSRKTMKYLFLITLCCLFGCGSEETKESNTSISKQENKEKSKLITIKIGTHTDTTMFHNWEGHLAHSFSTFGKITQIGGSTVNSEYSINKENSCKINYVAKYSNNKFLVKGKISNSCPVKIIFLGTGKVNQKFLMFKPGTKEINFSSNVLFTYNKN